MNLQDSWSPLMAQICGFHDHVIMVITFILCLVTYVTIAIIIIPGVDRRFFGNEILETVWTTIPGLILGAIALPSLFTLYLSDESSSVQITIKALGHQWFWSYEYGDFDEVSFSSYMLPDSDLLEGGARLLETDNRVVIPKDMTVRVVVSSSDVIHSWTVPSLGVKSDAVPGRLNQCWVNAHRLGVVYGQCSEICGALHSFIPITLEVTTLSGFENWVTNFS